MFTLHTAIDLLLTFEQKTKHVAQHHRKISQCGKPDYKQIGSDLLFDLFLFSFWGTFPCYLLHFGAKTSTLLSLEH